MLFKNIVIILLSFLILGCGGTSVNPSSFTSYEDVVVNGRVIKGPIRDSTVEIFRVDTNVSLGSTTTNDDGRYSLNIKDYKGPVRLIATGGIYKDEIDDLDKNATGVILKAVSVIDDSNKEVFITPFTTIASKNITSSNPIRIEEENKKVANLFMGSSFDITKVNPTVLELGTIIDNNSSNSIYGIFLAAFAKVTDSNASNIDANITSFYLDMNDSIVGASASALNIALSDGNIIARTGGTILSDLNSTTNSQSSLQIIRDYADSNTSNIPTVQDYENIGITTVTNVNIDEVNEYIELKTANLADTIIEIEECVAIVTSRVTITITDGKIGITTGEDVVFTFIFSQAVMAFIQDDISVSGGSKGAVIKVSDLVYTMAITPNSESTDDIVVSVAQGEVSTSESVINSASAEVTQEVDTINLKINYAGYADLNTTDTDGDKIILHFNKDIDESTLDNQNPQNLFDITVGKVISGEGNYTSSSKIYTITLDDGATADINSSVENVKISIKPNSIKDINNAFPRSFIDTTFTSGTVEFNSKVYDEVTSPDTNKTWLDRNLDANKVCSAIDDINCTGEYYTHASATCPIGFHVPTKTELANESTDLASAVDTTTELFASFLKFPTAGYKDVNGSMISVGERTHIWSSSIGADRGFSADDQSGSWADDNASRGYSIRCIKD